MSAVTERIGKQIREARKAKGLTQKELGEKLGVVKSVISEYEKGEQNLTIETLSRLAITLEVAFTIDE